MATLQHHLKLAFGLMALVAMACGSLQLTGMTLREHVHRNDDGCTVKAAAADAFCHGHDVCCVSDVESQASADLDGHNCPDYPHHHHHDGAGCCHTVVHLAARTVPSLALISPDHGRMAVDWIAMQSDLNAVCELDTPPII